LATFISFSAFAGRLNSGGAYLFHILHGEILDSLAVIIIVLVMAAVFGRGRGLTCLHHRTILQLWDWSSPSWQGTLNLVPIDCAQE
jgi:hypothetical protein